MKNPKRRHIKGGPGYQGPQEGGGTRPEEGYEPDPRQTATTQPKKGFPGQEPQAPEQAIPKPPRVEDKNAKPKPTADEVLTSPIKFVIDAPDAIDKAKGLMQKVAEVRPDLAPEATQVNQALEQMSDKATPGPQPMNEGVPTPPAQSGLPAPASAPGQEPKFKAGDRVLVNLDEGTYYGSVLTQNPDGTYKITTDQAMSLNKVPASAMAKQEDQSFMTLPASQRVKIKSARKLKAMMVNIAKHEGDDHDYLQDLIGFLNAEFKKMDPKSAVEDMESKQEALIAQWADENGYEAEFKANEAFLVPKGLGHVLDQVMHPAPKSQAEAVKAAGEPPIIKPPKKKLEEYDQDQLAKGMAVEKEHTPDENLAKQIAAMHLDENPDYYKNLNESAKGKEELVKAAEAPAPAVPATKFFIVTRSWSDGNDSSPLPDLVVEAETQAAALEKVITSEREDFKTPPEEEDGDDQTVSFLWYHDTREQSPDLAKFIEEAKAANPEADEAEVKEIALEKMNDVGEYGWWESFNLFIEDQSYATADEAMNAAGGSDAVLLEAGMVDLGTYAGHDVLVAGKPKSKPAGKKMIARLKAKRLRAATTPKAGYTPTETYVVVENNKPRLFNPDKDDTMPYSVFRGLDGHLAIISDTDADYEEFANDDVELAFWADLKKVLEQGKALAPKEKEAVKAALKKLGKVKADAMGLPRTPQAEALGEGDYSKWVCDACSGRGRINTTNYKHGRATEGSPEICPGCKGTGVRPGAPTADAKPAVEAKVKATYEPTKGERARNKKLLFKQALEQGFEFHKPDAKTESKSEPPVSPVADAKPEVKAARPVCEVGDTVTYLDERGVPTSEKCKGKVVRITEDEGIVVDDGGFERAIGPEDIVEVKLPSEVSAAQVEASAFDKIPEIEVGGGLTARRKKSKKEGKEGEAAEIEVVDADGKVVATYPDAFGDDTVMIIKFLRQIHDISETDDKKAAKKAPKAEAKDEDKIEKKPKALPNVEDKAEGKEKKAKDEDAKAELEASARLMEARMANIRVIAEQLLRKGYIQASQDDVDAILVTGTKTLAEAQRVAAKKAVDKKVLELLAQPEEELLLLKASLPVLEPRVVTVQASKDGTLHPMNLSAAGVDTPTKAGFALGLAFSSGFRR